MRTPLTLLICPIVLAGCAGAPSAPQPAATTYVSATGAPLAAAPLRADGTLDAKRVAEAKKNGYTLVNTNGELLYCRSDVKIGTHIRKNTDTTCLTAQQLDEMQQRTRSSLQNLPPVMSKTPPPGGR